MASTFANESAQELEIACIDTANRLLELCKLASPRVFHFEDINSSLLVLLFQKISGLTFSGLLHSHEKISQVHHIQTVIEILSQDVLGLSLSHISAEDIFAGDAIATLNLLEILEAVFLYLSSQENVDSKTNEINPIQETSSHRKLVHVISPSKKVLKKISKVAVEKSHKKMKSGFFTSHLSGGRNISDQHSPSKSTFLFTKDVERSPVSYNTYVGLENFHKKIKTFLIGKQSPLMKCQTTKKVYMKNFQSPYKLKKVPECNKSFLLPYNLRKRSYQQKPKLKKNKNVAQESLNQDRLLELKKGIALSKPIQRFLEEFPGFQFPVNTENILIKDYHRHLYFLHKQLKDAVLSKPEILKQVEIAEKKQHLMSNVLAKDIKQRHFLRSVKEEKAIESKIKYSLRDARLRSAKIRQYFDKYHTSMIRKLQQPNTKEELVVQQAFRRMLHSQRTEVRSLCRQLMEADYIDAMHYRQYVEALENIYQNHLSVLSEAIKTKSKEISERVKEDHRIIKKEQQKWRAAVQEDIHFLQENTLATMKDIHFRKLDAQKY